MNGLLGRLADHLLAGEGILAAFRNTPVRFIRRDTWTYQKIIDQSLAPAILVDPLRRDLLIHQLFRAAFTDGAPDVSDGDLMVIASEVDSQIAIRNVGRA